MNPTTPIALTIGLLLNASAIHANAQSVYRCGTTYSQTPCGEGQIVETNDSRTAAQRAQAKQVVADARRLADQMHHDRIVDEAAQRSVGPASLSGPSGGVGAVHRADKSAIHAKKKRATPKLPRATEFATLTAVPVKAKGTGHKQSLAH